MSHQTIQDSPGRSQIIDPQSADWQKFNQTSFSFKHSLDRNELLDLPHLQRLARKMVRLHGPERVSCLVGNKGADANWSDWKSTSSELDYCFERINEPGQSYIIIKDVERDPEYASFLTQTLQEFSSLLAPALYAQVTWPSAYLFIAAPGFFTPYHMDHETGVLLQIHGAKDLCLFDANDPSLLTQQERERYYMGNLDSATYRSEMVDRATVYRMSPGVGVHLPVNAPHWVRNLDSYSVSLSINFCLKAYDDYALVHQANYLLRRLGLSPRHPGASPVRDRAKKAAIALLSKRAPETKDEMLRSGVRRLNAVLTAGRRAAVSARTLVGGGGGGFARGSEL
ncbi:MAG TPA: hypothetical protein VKZ49_01105 [Polyangiaceae bacterium]|nr:hypothetical protein [Polyangiaceae bacterium]